MQNYFPISLLAKFDLILLFPIQSFFCLCVLLINYRFLLTVRRKRFVHRAFSIVKVPMRSCQRSSLSLRQDIIFPFFQNLSSLSKNFHFSRFPSPFYSPIQSHSPNLLSYMFTYHFKSIVFPSVYLVVSFKISKCIPPSLIIISFKTSSTSHKNTVPLLVLRDSYGQVISTNALHHPCGGRGSHSPTKQRAYSSTATLTGLFVSSALLIC